MRCLSIILPFFLMLLLLAPAGAFCADAAEDIIIADFEGETYPAGWTVEGTAFGPGPAQGTLPDQMDVTGFMGKGLVNSYFEGDDSTGKLTSPAFPLQRKYVSFLLGGGGHPGLEVNLRVDGKIVRTATGPNTVPGGSEALAWHDWDVSEFAGKEAVLEIVDDARGGWGHINVDQITLGNAKKQPVDVTREFKITQNYLHIPVSAAGPETWVRVEVDGVWQQEFRVRMPVSGKPDFYGNLYVEPFKGKTVTLIAEKIALGADPLALVRESDEKAQEDTVYTESRRPQFHFSTRTGWINDPNGLVYYDGVWHLFYQHNPYSTQWGNMTWGHATSPDLLHWTEQPTAIHPDKLGTIFSGSGVVDWKNTSGLQTPGSKIPPLVFLYTYDGGSARFGAPVTQGMAYSLDGGKTFQKYDKNPVLPHIVGGNRDPKVIWHEPTQRWIMALYMDGEDYALFASENLKHWEKLGDIKNLGCSECPDFFPLAVDGDKNNVKWVFWGGNGKYLLGTFDGKEFKPETPPLTNKQNGTNDYAAMTFSDAPDGRRVQISWMATWGDTERIFGGMPFNHQFTIPRELTLRSTPAGPRLFMNPVKEVETLQVGEPYTSEFGMHNVYSTGGGSTIIPLPGGLADVEMELKPHDNNDDMTIIMNLSRRSMDAEGKTTYKLVEQITYFVPESKLYIRDGGEAVVPRSDDGTLKLRMLVDRSSLEIFAQDGEVQLARCLARVEDADDAESELCLYFTIGFESTDPEPLGSYGAKVKRWELKSVWGRDKK